MKKTVEMRDMNEQIRRIREATNTIESALHGLTHENECSREDMLQMAFLAVRMYAETHPRPSHVTQAQAAEMIGMSASTVHRLVRSGVIKLDKAGQIPITEIDRALTAA